MPRLASLERELTDLQEKETVLERRIEKGENLLERLRWELRGIQGQIGQLEDEIKHKTPTPRSRVSSSEAREGITFGGARKKKLKPTQKKH